MRCILHVGTEKTATTTLQRFVESRREELGASGVVTTRSAGVGNNWRLAVAAYDDDRHDDRSRDVGVHDPGSRARFRSKLIDELQAELDATAPSGSGTVLFSSEHLHSRLTRPSEVARLAGLLRELGVDDPQVVIYLRDPVTLAASFHSTVVKHGSTRRHPPPPEPGTYYHNLCDHRGSIERWQEVFPRVTPRLFESEALVDGSIVADFCDALDLSVLPSAPDVDDGRLNRSLTTAEVEVLSRINEQIPYTIEGRPNRRHSELVAAVERHSSGPGYRLPPKLAQRYREAFADSNEWVRQRFFPERRYLFAAEDPEHPATPGPPGYDGLARLITELWPPPS